MIQKLNEVSMVEALTCPGERDMFKAPILQHLKLPGIFLMGEKWYLDHACKLCGGNVQVRHVDIEHKNSGWFFMTYLSWQDIGDIQLVDEMGLLFGLILSTISSVL